MDKARELRWTIPAVRKFEALAPAELEKLGLMEKQPGDEKAGPITAADVVLKYIGYSPILDLALSCCLDLEGEELDSALEAYEGSRQDLMRNVQEAFMAAEDPSMVASLQESWRLFDRLKIAEVEKKRAQAAEQVEKILNPPDEAETGKPPDSDTLS